MNPDTQCGRPVVSLTSDEMNNYNNQTGKLGTLGQQTGNATTKMYGFNNNLSNELKTNDKQFYKNNQEYNKVTNKIEDDFKLTEHKDGMQNLKIDDVNGILDDTDLRVLHQNYTYILWSILGIGVLTATLSTLKK
jgi:hypothetical protein